MKEIESETLRMSWDYKQPSFYRFSEDSIILAKHAIESLSKESKVLDVFAGCGVVGLEIFHRAADKIQSLTSVELQVSFRESLLQNIARAKSKNRKTEITVLFKDFQQLHFDKEYFDLIVANPPYFTAGSGRSSSDEKRQLCRFRNGFEFEEIFLFVEKYLNKEGKFIFCCRENLESLRPLIPPHRQLNCLSEVGENLFFIYR